MTDLRPIYFNEARARLVGNRLRVYMALMDAGPSTPKELAARMGWDVTSVRPRITEMRQIHAVNTTGIRRNGEHEFRALTASDMQAAHERPGRNLMHAELARAGYIQHDGRHSVTQLELIAP